MKIVNQLIAELMTNISVCKTAPATLDLVNIMQMSVVIANALFV